MSDFVDNMEKIINTIREDNDFSVEVNNIAGYIAVKTSTDEYFFQGEDKDTLEEEYRNAGVKDFFTLEEYILYVSQGW